MQNNPDQIAEMTAVRELERRDILVHVFEEAAVMLLVVDAASLRIVAANAEMRNFCQSDMRELSGQTVDSIFYLTGMERIARVALRLARRSSGRLSARLRARSGGKTFFDVIAVHTHGPHPSFLMSIRDSSADERARREIAAADARLNDAIESLPDGFVLYDDNDRMVICNETYRRIYSESAKAIVPGAAFEEILRYGLERGQYSEAVGREEDWLIERLIAHNALEENVEQQLQNGRWLRIVERPTANGGRVGLRIDVTTFKEQQAKLERMTRTDELTGLRNRRDLDQDVAEIAGDLPDGHRLAVFSIDLDAFKLINDAYGQAAGDTVLVTTSNRLLDIDPPPELVARMGGDEFTVAMIVGPGKDPLQLASALQSRLAAPIDLNGHDCTFSTSIGIASMSRDSAGSAAQVLNSSAIALSRAKRAAPGGIVKFRQSMRDEIVDRRNLASEIEEGIARGEFRPYFQPQFDVSTGRVGGFEALIRWERPSRPPVPADQFLRVATAHGLMGKLDEIVVEQSCDMIATLRKLGLTDAPVSINLSMIQLTDPGFLPLLQHRLAKRGLDHASMRIELLESTLLDDNATHIVRNVHDLIAAGFAVELDDFGTGHAAISTLRKFKVAQIKLDRSFVRHIDVDSDLKLLTSAIIDLAHNLDVSIIAEGVETPSEQDCLLTLGCYRAQGYLHAKPMPLEALLPFLVERGEITVEVLDADRDAASAAADRVAQG